MNATANSTVTKPEPALSSLVTNLFFMYGTLLSLGFKAQEARTVLPTSTKTEIVVKTNFTEWRHIFKMRTPFTAHPQMRQLMVPLLREVKSLIPVVFDDLELPSDPMALKFMQEHPENEVEPAADIPEI